MSNIVEQVRQELQGLASKSTQKSFQRFSKEAVKAYDIKTPIVRSIAKNGLKQLEKQDKEAVFGFCEELWQSGYIEESIIACVWSYSLRKRFEPADFEIFEKWIATYVDNWASCDTFCNHTVGEFLLMYPEYITRLKKWGSADNRWVRRASSVSLILPARKGKFLNDVLEIARLQLEDEDDLVQKGYGWMLKVTSQQHEKAVFDFIMEHKSTMPRTALCYAIEKMPAELKVHAMAR